MNHRTDCAQTEYRECPVKKSLYGEKVTEHWWSGWPGAYCIKCGDEDKNEICLGTGCECKCHDEFWKQSKESITITTVICRCDKHCRFYRYEYDGQQTLAYYVEEARDDLKNYPERRIEWLLALPYNVRRDLESYVRQLERSAKE
jgi:hypothetical protein